MTKNYGLLGGELDPNPHIAKAIQRLCTPSEIDAYYERADLGVEAGLKELEDWLAGEDG